jgi:hypothetical protein
MARAPSNADIITIADELGLPLSNDPSGKIVAYCQDLTAFYIREYEECSTSDELLSICAQKMGTKFEILSSNSDLDRTMSMWAERGELQFATIERELERGALGITFRLRRPFEWEQPYVSVIDARGERQRRAWFTKWHEIGHLLILAGNARESFRRTHGPEQRKDPEEVLVDRIASACGFHPSLIRTHANGPLTFKVIESLRDQLFPGASMQAARIGVANAWPIPCFLLECRMINDLSSASKEQTYSFRAVHVWSNEAARQAGLRISTNMCVCEPSLVKRV